MNCSEYLVDYLIKNGVKDIFGYAGGYITLFMDALHKRRNEINVHVCYHEQGCAFAADGYARVTGNVGVFFTTSGPGAINALGGIADAWFDSVPLFAICGNTNTYETVEHPGIRQIGFQEADVVSISSSITKFSVSPQNPLKFIHSVDIAYKLAISGRKGSVLFDFPFDLQKADISCR